MLIHTVQKGDTLWQISKQYQISLDALIAANPQIMDPNKIMPGMQIYIPHYSHHEMGTHAMAPEEDNWFNPMDPNLSNRENRSNPPGKEKWSNPPDNWSNPPGKEKWSNPPDNWSNPPSKGNEPWPNSQEKEETDLPMIHYVCPGDTWENLAMRYGVMPDHLKSSNAHLPPNQPLIIGTKIIISGSNPAVEIENKPKTKDFNMFFCPGCGKKFPLS
ncbi:MAG: SafA/ExsA family spore coat assembly protein [Bacillota bacterium]|jgi:spore coat assembly protein SafA